MVADPRWWLGYLGQSLANVVLSTSHTEAVGIAKTTLAELIEQGAVTDQWILNCWREITGTVQAPGTTKGEEDGLESSQTLAWLA